MSNLFGEIDRLAHATTAPELAELLRPILNRLAYMAVTGGDGDQAHERWREATLVDLRAGMGRGGDDAAPRAADAAPPRADGAGTPRHRHKSDGHRHRHKSDSRRRHSRR
jgi:hypothetical protein